MKTSTSSPNPNLVKVRRGQYKGNCSWCGKPFTARHPNGRYCSPECHAFAQREYNRLYRQGYRRREGEKERAKAFSIKQHTDKIKAYWDREVEIVYALSRGHSAPQAKQALFRYMSKYFRAIASNQMELADERFAHLKGMEAADRRIEQVLAEMKEKRLESLDTDESE